MHKSIFTKSLAGEIFLNRQLDLLPGDFAEAITEHIDSGDKPYLVYPSDTLKEYCSEVYHDDSTIDVITDWCMEYAATDYSIEDSVEAIMGFIKEYLPKLFNFLEND